MRRSVMDSKNIAIPAVALLISCISSNMAQASPPPENSSVYNIRLGCISSFIVSRPAPGNEFMDIKAAMSKNGGLTNTTVTRYTSDDQYNAECLEAICNVFKCDHKDGETPFEMRIGGGNALRPHTLVEEPFKEFEKAHPNLFNGEAKFVVVHRIPLNVWQGCDRSLFTGEELQAATNLVAVPVGDNTAFGAAGERSTAPKYVEIIEKRGRRWADFFAATHHKASKVEIENCAKEIDTQIR
jgi:hypothetical protein